MSVSTLTIVRFSPDPEVGEWLNLAVFGTNREEARADIAFGPSLARIRWTFGEEAKARAERIGKDLKRFAARVQRELTEDPFAEVSTLGDAIRDQGLSIKVSSSLMVFDGTMQEAIEDASRTYLGASDSQERDVPASSEYVYFDGFLKGTTGETPHHYGGGLFLQEPGSDRATLANVSRN